MGSWYCAAFSTPSNPIAPLWSVSVEEQFYLFIPFVAKRGGRKGLAAIAAVLYMLALYVLSLLVDRHATKDAIWFNTFVQFSAFAAGLLLAASLQKQEAISSRAVQLSIAAGAVALLLSGSVIFNIKGFTASTWINLAAGYTVVGLGSALCIFAFIARPWSPPNFLLYLGKISYGLYVFHAWCVSLSERAASRILVSASHDSIAYVSTRIAISLILCVIMAGLSYRFLESRFLRLKDRFAQVPSRPV
jgi:peptidoglycan/LPS O-acetylase OafA/YrhL